MHESTLITSKYREGRIHRTWLKDALNIILLCNPRLELINIIRVFSCFLNKKKYLLIIICVLLLLLLLLYLLLLYYPRFATIVAQQIPG